MIGRNRKVWKEELRPEIRKDWESHAAIEGRVIMEKGKDGREGSKTYVEKENDELEGKEGKKRKLSEGEEND